MQSMRPLQECNVLFVQGCRPAETSRVHPVARAIAHQQPQQLYQPHLLQINSSGHEQSRVIFTTAKDFASAKGQQCQGWCQDHGRAACSQWLLRITSPAQVATDAREDKDVRPESLGTHGGQSKKPDKNEVGMSS